jgi:hypothetical protein
MSDNLFVERRDGGDYAVRKPGSQRASAIEPTQKEAIERAGAEPGCRDSRGAGSQRQGRLSGQVAQALAPAG